MACTIGVAQLPISTTSPKPIFYPVTQTEHTKHLMRPRASTKGSAPNSLKNKLKIPN